MESGTARHQGVDLGARTARPGLALALAVLSVPGSTLTWDLFDLGGFVTGLPLAVAAIVLGVQARQRATDGRGKATTAIFIAGAMIAMMVVWTAVEVLS